MIHVLTMYLLSLCVYSIEMGDASASQQINRQYNKADACGNSLAQDIRIENFDVSFGAQYVLCIHTYSYHIKVMVMLR